MWISSPDHRGGRADAFNSLARQQQGDLADATAVKSRHAGDGKRSCALPPPCAGYGGLRHNYCASCGLVFDAW